PAGVYRRNPRRPPGPRLRRRPRPDRPALLHQLRVDQPRPELTPPPPRGGGWGGGAWKLNPDRFADQDHGGPARRVVLVQDQRARDLGPHPHRLAQARVLIRKDVLLDAAKRRVEVRHDLLAADDQDQLAGAGGDGSNLAAA